MRHIVNNHLVMTINPDQFNQLALSELNVFLQANAYVRIAQSGDPVRTVRAEKNLLHAAKQYAVIANSIDKELFEPASAPADACSPQPSA